MPLPPAPRSAYSFPPVDRTCLHVACRPADRGTDRRGETTVGAFIPLASASPDTEVPVPSGAVSRLAIRTNGSRPPLSDTIAAEVRVTRSAAGKRPLSRHSFRPRATTAGGPDSRPNPPRLRLGGFAFLALTTFGAAMADRIVAPGLPTYRSHDRYLGSPPTAVAARSACVSGVKLRRCPAHFHLSRGVRAPAWPQPPGTGQEA